MSRRAIAALLSLAASAPIAAGADEPAARGARPGAWSIDHAFVPVTLGVTRPTAISPLNAALEAAAYEPLPLFLPTVGVAITAVYRNGLVIEPGYRFTIASVEESILTVHHLLLSFGYMAHARGEIALYPLLGAGLGNATLEIGDPELAPQPFDEAIGAPVGDALLSSTTFVLHAGLASNLWGSGHGDFIGVRTGLVIAPYQSLWKRRGVDVEGGPAAPISGAYLAVAAGFGAPTGARDRAPAREPRPR